MKPVKNKKIYFLAGFPRAGNTLLTSILNQNPDICCTPNSITLEIYKDVWNLKQTDVFLNLLYKDSIILTEVNLAFSITFLHIIFEYIYIYKYIHK